MRIINYNDFIPHLNWNEAVNALKEGHHYPKAEIGDLFLGPDKATLLNRAAFIKGLGYGVKAVTVMDENRHRHLPTVQGGMFFFDHETGSLRAILESRLVTDIKTAADSVCGASFLARENSHTLLIVGAGNMAQSIAHAYSALFPSLKNIMIWSRRPEQAEKLAQSLHDLRPSVKAVPDLAQSCAQADIISTVTMAREPIICGAWIKPGTHIDLIGAYKADMREADDDLISIGRLFVDSRDTTIHHIGELIEPLRSGIITESSILGDLYDLVKGRAGRSSHDDITIFKNGGGAHLDTMIAHYMTQTLS
ncbi:NAD(P)-binding domain-containing protein [Aristophania vespae]|uniref:NAD(P)-binding domain-containing protein n=1 Tax=Aristophania vespae TaxID=2697033 RepID=A0A6P1NFD9_9PROT|nr:NAD(P)-binding domain-containing protein [Aristophania vespae]QHI95270.1 NAD(P)-binding domain-containing protein [Aristophania vespae]